MTSDLPKGSPNNVLRFCIAKDIEVFSGYLVRDWYASTVSPETARKTIAQARKMSFGRKPFRFADLRPDDYSPRRFIDVLPDGSIREVYGTEVRPR